MSDTNPDVKYDTERVEQPGDDEPCERCADREEDCPACQETYSMNAHDWTRQMYGDTSEEAL